MSEDKKPENDPSVMVAHLKVAASITRWSKAEKMLESAKDPIVILGVAWALVRITENLGGKETGLWVNIQSVVGSQVSCVVCVSFGFAGTVWGYFERRARKRLIAGKSAHIASLETRLHPERGSSNLLSDGTSNPKD